MPSPSDIKTILDMSPDAVVARDHQHLMVFEDKKFVRSGPYFCAQPRKFSSPNDQKILNIMESLGDFTVDEAAKAVYPHIYARGRGYILEDIREIWSNDKKQLQKAYPGREIKECDFRNLARIRVGNYVYSKFKDMGWIEKTEGNKWRIIASKSINLTSKKQLDF